MACLIDRTESQAHALSSGSHTGNTQELVRRGAAAAAFAPLETAAACPEVKKHKSGSWRLGQEFRPPHSHAVRASSSLSISSSVKWELEQQHLLRRAVMRFESVHVKMPGKGCQL